MTQKETIQTTVGFIGAGQMARALAGGFVGARLVEPSRIMAADALPSACDAFVDAIPEARSAASNRELVLACDIVFLSVKPQNVGQVCDEIRTSITDRKLIVSIVAGVTLGRLAESLGTERLIRVMPNTPCLVGDGAAGFSRAAGATDTDAQHVTALLSATGYVAELEESLIDAVTGLSGSGPAYIYQVIEALSDGGVQMGLPREIASQLAAATVRGAAEMVIQTGERPAVLKDRVASAGGTTVAGLQALEAGGMQAAIIAAVEAATRRSRELGRE